MSTNTFKAIASKTRGLRRCNGSRDECRCERYAHDDRWVCACRCGRVWWNGR